MGRQKKRKTDHQRQDDWRRKEAQIQFLIRTECYELSDHVHDKIADNYWALEDVENALLTGSICKVENDDKGGAIDGKKYTLMGHGCHGHDIVTVGKIVEDENGNEYFVITAY